MNEKTRKLQSWHKAERKLMYETNHENSTLCICSDGLYNLLVLVCQFKEIRQFELRAIIFILVSNFNQLQRKFGLFLPAFISISIFLQSSK